MNNIILMTDSYKVSHWKQYPGGTTHVYSYFESRGGKYSDALFFGLQYILKKYLVGAVVTEGNIREARQILGAHFGSTDFFFELGWKHILYEHRGRLPIEIKAVPEGRLIDTQNVLFTVENTCPQCFWVTSYLEATLEQVWYPITVATKSYKMKLVIEAYLLLTGDDTADFKLHDFGYRGSTSQESAAIGDAAHLVNFKGSDTLPGLMLLQKYYGAEMPAFSIPAAEHSTITAWGKDEEKFAYENMLNQFPTGLVAVVSDSYDIFNACENIWGTELKEKVENRKGVLIIRPDSGNPLEVLPRVLAILGEKFGYRENLKGYKVLPPFLRVIQGDGITEETLTDILEVLRLNKWSADNIAFGSGGGLLQDVNRDTMRFAYKCSNVTIGGDDFDVSKNPVTDPGKASKKGRLALVPHVEHDVDTHITIQYTDKSTIVKKDMLVPVFRDGELLKDYTLSEIQEKLV